MLNLTISIVNYNTKDLLIGCLESIYQNTKGLTFEVFVVDNASSDDSVKTIEILFPQVKLIKNNENIFFANAHNQVKDLANGEYFCILNSDTIIHVNVFSVLIKKLKSNTQIGAISCKLLSELGNVQESIYKKATIFNTLSLSRYLSRILKPLIPSRSYPIEKYEKNQFVEVLQDSLIILPRKLAIEKKIYYPRLKLYCTEDQIAEELNIAGLKLFYCAEVSAIHLLSKSTRPDKNPIYIYKIGRDDYFYFFLKYRGLIPAIIVYFFLSIDIFLIYLISLLKRVIMHK